MFILLHDFNSSGYLVFYFKAIKKQSNKKKILICFDFCVNRKIFLVVSLFLLNMLN